MYKFINSPWRCWDRMSLPSILNAEDNLIVRVALRNRRNHYYQCEFRWDALYRLGPNDFDGSYAQISLRFGEVKWSFEASNIDDRTYILVRKLDGNADEVEIRLETFFRNERDGEVVSREEEVIARNQNRAWKIFAVSPSAHREGTTITAPLNRPFFAIIQAAGDAGIRLENRSEKERISANASTPLTSEEKKTAELIASSRKKYLEKFSNVPKEIWWAYAGVPYVTGWNMIWADDREEPIEVCSRDWCVHGNYGSWVLFNWDTFLLAASAADYDTRLAHQILRPQFAMQTSDGLIPGIASPLGISADRAMPPVASFGIWKTYLRSKDSSFINDYYEPLRRYHEWWRLNRDGNKDGLLEWGSNPVKPAHPQWQAHTLWASRYETGMDNHPMWDDVRFNTLTHTQEQNDAGLSALYALDAKCLSKMASILGRKNEAEKYFAESIEMANLIDKNLWNDDVELWLSRGWDGKWNYRAAPTCFYPMFLDNIADKNVEAAIQKHLLNPKRFGGKYAIPVSPRDDPAYPEQYYVRGRIWPAQVLLVHSALREKGKESAAEQIARSALETMRNDWLMEGHLHENYNADTADAHDTKESDPVYSFGLMLPLIAWFHLHDFTIDSNNINASLSSLGHHLDKDGALIKIVEPLNFMEPLY